MIHTSERIFFSLYIRAKITHLKLTLFDIYIKNRDNYLNKYINSRLLYHDQTYRSFDFAVGFALRFNTLIVAEWKV